MSSKRISRHEGRKPHRRHQKVGGAQHGGPARPPEHMERYLRDLDFPSRKAYLITQARAHHAPSDVVSVLEHIPDALYDSPGEVTRVALEVY